MHLTGGVYSWENYKVNPWTEAELCLISKPSISVLYLATQKTTVQILFIMEPHNNFQP